MSRKRIRRKHGAEHTFVDRVIKPAQAEKGDVAAVATMGRHDIRRLGRIGVEVGRAEAVVQRDGEPPTAAPPTPANPQTAMMHAMFQGGVVTHIRYAHELLNQRKPNLKGAVTEMMDAISTLQPMGAAANAANDETQALRIIDLKNILLAEARIVDEHAGHPIPISQIAEEVDPNVGAVQSRIQGIEAGFESHPVIDPVAGGV